MQRRRQRRFEALEDRRLLAAYINEILFDPLFGDDNTEQYVELRGPAGSTMDQGTYLVVVESEKGIDNSQGQIHGIFDLSGLSFGSNGFLVLLPLGSPFQSHPAATTLKSTTEGFGGLPGGIYTDSHPLSDRIDFIYASNTFFLIQTDVAPQLGDDIDADSDGYVDPDGIITQWNVLDSLSTMWGLNDGYAYGQIVFIDVLGHNPVVTADADATVVNVEGSGYVGRIGNSTGWAATDWAYGTVKDKADDGQFYRLAGDIHGRPSPYHLHGRELDSVGSENFTGAARIGVYEDLNTNGQFDAGEPVIEGTQVLADTNGNGVRDLLLTTIEPDDFEERKEINNLTPGVSLNTTIDTNDIWGFDITPVQEAFKPDGQYIFAHANVGFFNNDRRLRMDFYRPAQKISIDITGSSTTTYGRLEVFDSQGNSLQMLRTPPLADGQRMTMTIDRGTDDIAYAVAYSDNNFNSSSPFGRLDTLRFWVPEAVATTDATGLATLNYLDPGTYELIAWNSPDSNYLSDPYGIEITKYENFDLSVGFRHNEPPVFEDATLTINENATGGTIVGQVKANDDPTQFIQYSISTGGDRFTIDPTTGVIRSRANANFNFENAAQHTVRVRASDNAINSLSAEKTFTVQVLDVNETPVLGNVEFAVPEMSAIGTVVGTLQGVDPDAGVNGLLRYRITGGNPNNAVFLNGETGQLVVNNPQAFNSETNPQFTIEVEVFDGGTPSLFDPAVVTVIVSDVNEPPTISTNELAVGELSGAGDRVGLIGVVDPDLGQTHTFSWGDDFTSDLFEMDAITGEIRLIADDSLNYTESPEYFVSVKVTDSGIPALSAEKQIRIRIIDENNPPKLHPLELSVPEGSAPGTLLGQVTVDDPDVGQTHVFAITSGDGGQRFVIDRNTGEIRVAPGAVLDYETKSSWTINVQAWDSGEPTATAGRQFVIAVTNVNEAPSLTVSPIAIAEDTTAGSVIGQAQGTDPDGDTVLTYALAAGDDAAVFTIDSGTGELRIADGVELDYETQSSYQLMVTVTDGESEPVGKELVVTVTDVNEAPVIVGSLEPITVTAGMSVEVVLPTDLATDVDAGQSLTWSLTAVEGQLPAWLQFNSATHTITGMPWNGDAAEIALRWVVKDNGQPSLSDSIDFNLTVQVNAAPWRNEVDPLDVNGNGTVEPIDALKIINYLNRGDSMTQVPGDVNYRPAFLDVNGNNTIEPIDALRIINSLNRGESEGEGLAVAGGSTPASLSGYAGDINEETRRRNAWDAALLGYLGATSMESDSDDE